MANDHQKRWLSALTPFYSDAILESTITCPACGHARAETMPTDACLWFYECEACRTVLRPRPGDCCVFCSYGTVKCPPMQHTATGCCAPPKAP